MREWVEWRSYMFQFPPFSSQTVEAPQWNHDDWREAQTEADSEGPPWILVGVVVSQGREFDHREK